MFFQEIFIFKYSKCLALWIVIAIPVGSQWKDTSGRNFYIKFHFFHYKLL